MTYMQGEVAHQVKLKPIRLQPLRKPRRYHLYCSANNDGALAVGEELQSVLSEVSWTANLDKLNECDRMLIHLTSATWTRPESDALGREVAQAMRAGVSLLLLHEVRSGRRGDNEKRYACYFAHFFAGRASTRTLACL